MPPLRSYDEENPPRRAGFATTPGRSRPTPDEDFGKGLDDFPMASSPTHLFEESRNLS